MDNVPVDGMHDEQALQPGGALAAAAAAAAGPPLAPGGPSAQDSGVETECDQESNDSSMSNMSMQNGPPNGPLPPLPGGAGAPPAGAPAVGAPAIGAPATGVAPSVAPAAAAAGPAPGIGLGASPAVAALVSSSSLSAPEAPSNSNNSFSGGLGPPLSVSEDGYLGDCSSDGGNEKNFPMPIDKLKRLMNHKMNGTESSAGSGSESVVDSSDFTFQGVQPDLLSAACSHFVLNNARGSSHHHHSAAHSSRKMKSLIRNRFSHHNNATNWSQIKTSIAERKLRLAANTNNTESLSRLLESGVNPNCMDEYKRSALHFGAAKGYSDIVELLLRHNADPNLKDGLGNTPLHLAACTNHVEVVTLLLRAGTDVTELDNHGRTPMQLAQSKLKLLQRAGASTSSGPGAAEMSSVKAEVAQVIEMMREYLAKTGHAGNSAYNELLNSFSQRLTLHQTQDDINSDLQNLLDSLGNLQV